MSVIKNPAKGEGGEKDICELCQKEWNPDEFELGYVWICPECQDLPSDCDCGSDDVQINWSVYEQGQIITKPVWRVECFMCNKQTIPFESAKEALDAWENGDRMTPIPGTDHYEEAW